MDKQVWGGISAALILAGSVPYITSTIRGTTRPQVFSWTIWGLAGAIVSAAQYVKHAGAGNWVIWADVILSLCIAGLAFRQGDRRATRLDWLVLSAALLALPLWYVTANALAAVLLIAVVDFLGFVPTFRKSWSRPQDEAALSYAIYALAFLAALPAVENYNAATVFYPSFLAACNLCLLLMLSWRRRVIAAR